MSILKQVWNETIGMFVDDGRLALMVVGLIAAVTLLVAGAGLSPVLAEAVLPLGLALILIASVQRARKRR